MAQDVLIEAAEVAAGAVSAVAESFGRTVQDSQAVATIARDYLSESADAYSRLLTAGMGCLTASAKAGFAMQNAVLAAGIAFTEAAYIGNRELAMSMGEAARQSQRARLALWQSCISAADNVAANVVADR